ncbi:hypothetical protein FRC09_011820 [Ceratobasidium sp. 395]|nr:hypothetical protein FRC09_011820 [Ceratobasidium sp. 395]
MRRITSALGLTRGHSHKSTDDKRRRPPPSSATYLRASESTPALVHHFPDSASSSGVRTPSDVEAPDMLSVPAIHAASASSDSVANSTRSTKSSRWLPTVLLRSLSRKRRTSAPPPAQPLAPPIETPDDASSDTQSTNSSRPRSPPPPVLLHPPAPSFAAPIGRRTSSPANSVYRAGLANVPRRAPPSRANMVLHAFTQPLVLGAGAATPHPLTAPDPTSPALFPRSVVARGKLGPSHSLRTHVHRARVLRRLEEGALTAAEEASIMPFATRSPRSPSTPSRRVRPSLSVEEAIAELGTGTGRWSRGLRRWVARPVFEDRTSVFRPAEIGVEVDLVRPARGLGTEMLDFSDGTLAMAGLALDSDGESDSDLGERSSQSRPAAFLDPIRFELTIPSIICLAHLHAPQAIKPSLQIQTAPSSRRQSLQLPSHTPSPTSPARTSLLPGIEEGSALGTEATRKARKASVPPVRGVRFADDEDATDGDDLPLAVLVAVQKKRAEREARARHQTLMREQARRSENLSRRYELDGAGSDRGNKDKKRSYAEEIARARMLQGSARAGMERPATFVRETESSLRPDSKRESSSPARPAGAGHARSGSGGTTASATHKRRNTVGEANLGVPVPASPLPVPALPWISGASSLPPSPGFMMPGLPSSAPSTPPGFPSPSQSPRNLPHSNSYPMAQSHSRAGSASGSVSGLPSPQTQGTFSGTRSPLRSSFALNTDEMGITMANNAIMFNQAVIANNAAMLAAHQAMISNMGMPNPPFAGNASGSSSTGSGRGRGMTSPYATVPRSRSANSSPRPGPLPMQRSGSGAGSAAGDRKSTAGSGAGDRRGSVAGDRASVGTQSRHAHSRSEHTNVANGAGRRTSKLSIVSDAAPMPAIPTGIYSSRPRPRPGTEVIT